MSPVTPASVSTTQKHSVRFAVLRISVWQTATKDNDGDNEKTPGLVTWVLGVSRFVLGRSRGSNKGLLPRSGEFLVKAPLWGASCQGARTSPKQIGEYSLCFAVLRISVWQTATKANDA